MIVERVCFLGKDMKDALENEAEQQTEMAQVSLGYLYTICTELTRLDVAVHITSASIRKTRRHWSWRSARADTRTASEETTTAKGACG
jgi:hypothetical protein